MSELFISMATEISKASKEYLNSSCQKKDTGDVGEFCDAVAH